MKAAETHKMSNEEIVEETGRLRNRLFELKGQAVTEKLENPMRLKAIRRDIARLETEKRAREIKAERASA